MATLTLIDLVGIQDFVFASNRLKDVAGGSRLVAEATDRDGWLAELGVAERALVAAGGNVLLRSESRSDADGLVGRFTRKLIDEAPGLSAAVVHAEEGERGFAATLQELHRKMPEVKGRRRPSLETLGVGVTARCRETGTVASVITDDETYVSAGVEARRRALRTRDLVAEDAFRVTPEAPPVELRFPIENDQLGRSPGEKSLLGVVHVDANGVGARLSEWLDQQGSGGGSGREVESRFREISTALAGLVEAAWDDVRERAKSRIAWDPRHDRFELTSPRLGERFALYRDGDKLFLPVRPILLGGDDLTFLCDGRIALDLAATALARFEASEVPGLGRLGACAGVILVHAHAPFARAAEWSHRLCTSAKRSLRAGAVSPEPGACALDWHVGLPNPQETVEGLRERLYTRRDDGRPESLTSRPCLLGAPDLRESWRWLASTVLGPQGASAGSGDERSACLRGSVWRDHRNKVKQLESLVRSGREALSGTLAAWRIAAPKLALPGGLEGDGGFFGDRTPLLDAVELMDLHWPLDPPEDQAAPAEPIEPIEPTEPADQNQETR